MKKPEIFQFKVEINRCYIIQQEGTIMMDGGSPNQIESIKKSFKTLNINPKDIRLVVLSHGHFDHAGSAKEIRELTGAKILVHKNDNDMLETAEMIWPPAANTWGSITRSIFKPLLKNKVKFQKTQADIVMEGSEFSLKDFGIDGKIIHTPGHTNGSISVLLNSGEAFVGCMAHNDLPFRLRPGFPIYAHDIPQLKKSWEMMIDMGATTIYPGHGDPFSVEVIQRILEKENHA